MTREDHRPLRGIDHFKRSSILIGIEALLAYCYRKRIVRGAIELARGLLGILCDIYQNGTRTATACQVERGAQCRSHIFRTLYEIVVFGDRQSDAGDVGFLKRISAEEFTADLTGDADDRRRVHHGSGNSGDHVGGAWT